MGCCFRTLFRYRAKEEAMQALYHHGADLTLRVPDDYVKALNGVIWDSPG